MVLDAFERSISSNILLKRAHDYLKIKNIGLISSVNIGPCNKRSLEFGKEI